MDPRRVHKLTVPRDLGCPLCVGDFVPGCDAGTGLEPGIVARRRAGGAVAEQLGGCLCKTTLGRSFDIQYGFR